MEEKMDEKDLAIKIEGLKKMYRLGTIGGGTLRGDIESWWAKKRGKEDPNSKIGSNQQIRNETFMALDGIDLTVRKGERLGIIGHNGAGKSTLLKLLSRVTAPTEGNICIDGRISSMLEVGTGFNGELTGRENIYLNGAILGMTKAEVDSKIEKIIDFSECRQFIDTPVKRYSSGMYVKLAFAVAAHLDSEILIMDEVLAVGDVQFQKKCLRKMSDISREEGRTILYVSHNMNTIRQLCERCVVMNHGKIIFDGDVEQAISKYSKGNELTTNKVDYNLINAERPSNQHGEKIFITEFKFLNKGSAVFERTETMQFEVSFITKESLKGLKLYFTLVSSGVRIGTAQTYEEFADVTKGKSYKCRFKFDISNLAPEIYSFQLDIFAEDGCGHHYSYDHPRSDFTFEVVDSHLSGIMWQKYFGFISLNPIIKIQNSLEEKNYV
jgi:lipopolysaccharide transport system ATP-binding protein